MTEIVYTHRTRTGKKARIICDNFVSINNTTILAAVFYEHEKREYIVEYDENLKAYGLSTYDDLIEYSFWNDVAVNTPVLVRRSIAEEWQKRHFAKYENGTVYTFYDGRTSWTDYATSLTAWEHAKLPEKE